MNLNIINSSRTINKPNFNPLLPSILNIEDNKFNLTSRSNNSLNNKIELNTDIWSKGINLNNSIFSLKNSKKKFKKNLKKNIHIAKKPTFIKSYPINNS